MVSLSTRAELVSALPAHIAVPTNSSTSTESFSQQLATALEGALNQPGGSGPIDIQVSQVPGQNSGGSQFLVTVTSGASTPPASTSGATGTTTTTSSTSSTVTKVPDTTQPGTMEQLFSGGPVTVAEGGGSPSQAASTGPVTEADAYWNEQPTAVQALRNMPDGAAKDQLALSLANQGYTIDNQIMVMGWDPETTMMIRQDYGYSWVPSYGQSPITVAPGVSDPLATSTYNPDNPPAGAIKVSTAFAVGTIQTPDALLMQQEASGAI
jgi:hypothetical protein